MQSRSRRYPAADERESVPDNLPGLRIAGKTGTAKVSGRKNVGWFICFAPLENPEIAIAVTVEGDTAGEVVGGRSFASPVAQALLKAWWEKKHRPPAAQGVAAPSKPQA